MTLPFAIVGCARHFAVDKAQGETSDGVVQATPNEEPAVEPPFERTTEGLPVEDSSWIATLNHYRVQLGLAPVVEDGKLSASCAKHAAYCVHTGTLLHQENRASPFFTTDGNTAATKSVVTGAAAEQSELRAIEYHWMQAPFHWVDMISPRLASAGYGSLSDPEGAVKPSIRWAAALDVISGVKDVPPGNVSFPVLFPAPGTTVPMGMHWGETPDPLETCGYARPAGLPIIVQYGQNASLHLGEHSLEVDGVLKEHCILTADTLSMADAAEKTIIQTKLRQAGAVVLIPKAPLAAGAVVAVGMAVGKSSSAWSFTVSSHPWTQ